MMPHVTEVSERKKPLGEVEEVDGQAMMAQTIGLIQRAMDAVERDAGAVEDYDGKKADLLKSLDELKVKVVETQAQYEAMASEIRDGKRRQAIGIENDAVEVGESETLRRGEFALQELYDHGDLDRDLPLVAQRGILEEMQVRLAKELKGAVRGSERTQNDSNMQQLAYKDLLEKVLAAARYLEYATKKNDGVQDEEEEVIVASPSEEALEKLDR